MVGFGIIPLIVFAILFLLLPVATVLTWKTPARAVFLVIWGLIFSLVALFSVFGFMASFEYEFPNKWHVIYVCVGGTSFILAPLSFWGAFKTLRRGRDGNN
jgi:hypothetical protein